MIGGFGSVLCVSVFQGSLLVIVSMNRELKNHDDDFVDDDRK